MVRCPIRVRAGGRVDRDRLESSLVQSDAGVSGKVARHKSLRAAGASEMQRRARRMRPLRLSSRIRAIRSQAGEGQTTKSILKEQGLALKVALSSISPLSTKRLGKRCAFKPLILSPMGQHRHRESKLL